MARVSGFDAEPVADLDPDTAWAPLRRGRSVELDQQLDLAALLAE